MTPGPARSRWTAVAVTLTAALAAASVAMGFLVLPDLEGAGGAGVWDSICRAAGVLRAAPAAATVVQAGPVTTAVVVTPGMMGDASPASIGQGATLAMQCAVCHGARGVSGADVPNLAGQYAPAVFKELLDYQSGARSNAVMGPRAVGLSGQDMRDLAAYYAYLPRLDRGADAGPAPPIVLSGAPMRNIPPCGACHGGIATKTGSAWLDGAPAAYLQGQLEAFATGARHNDISQQMRNIARNMTAAEIAGGALLRGRLGAASPRGYIHDHVPIAVQCGPASPAATPQRAVTRLSAQGRRHKAGWPDAPAIPVTEASGTVGRGMAGCLGPALAHKALRGPPGSNGGVRP